MLRYTLIYFMRGWLHPREPMLWFHGRDIAFKQVSLSNSNSSLSWHPFPELDLLTCDSLWPFGSTAIFWFINCFRLCVCSWGISMSPSCIAMPRSPPHVAVTTLRAALVVVPRAVQNGPSRVSKRTAWYLSWHSMVHDAYVMWQRKKDRDSISLYRKSRKNVWWTAYHRKWVDYDRLSCRQPTQFEEPSSNCCAYFSFCFELSLSASCPGFALLSHLLWCRKGKNENPKEAMTAWTTLVRKLKRTKSKDLGPQSFGLNLLRWI